MSEDLEESEEVEKNDQNVDSLDADGVEERLLVVLDEQHVQTVSREDGQQDDEEENHPHECRETDGPAATLLK